MKNAIAPLGAIAVLAAAGCGTSQPASAPPQVLPPAAPHEWRAEPAMISNVGVYRQHEFVYQDYVYDDKGANTDGRDRFDAPLGAPGPDPNQPTDIRQSPAPLINWAGDFQYASTDASHMRTVADFIEFRVAADAQRVYYRFRMGDMTTPDSAVIGMCVDEDGDNTTGIQQWPFGAGLDAALGCDHFYTLWGTGGRIDDAAGHQVDLAAAGGTISTDVNEALIEVSVPKSIANPGHGRWRYFVASGVWDPATQTWSAPTPVPTQAGAPVATGGSPFAPAIYDLLSNNHEPNATWNEEKQANDLASHNIADDFLDVDFARLDDGRNDPDPQRTGAMVRIYRSQFPMDAPGRGIEIDPSNAANKIYLGEWQPYTVVIPHDYYDDPARRFPLDSCLHPLSTNHNVEVFYSEAFARSDYNPVLTGVYPSTGYLGFDQIESLVDQEQIVYSCVLGRGEGVGYQGGDGLVDALEVEREMQAHYRTDPDRHTVHGVSLGAIGSWYMARLYPDRYAAAMPYIFTQDITGGVYAAAGVNNGDTLANLYNLPVYFAIGTFDEFGQGTEGDLVANAMESDGNEFLFIHYLAREHEGRIENDFLPFAAKLAYTRTRVSDPARVRYVFRPSMFSSKIPGDGGAYWVSGMKVRDAAVNSGAATIDATSLARASQLPAHQVVLDAVYVNPDRLFNVRMRGLFRLSQQDFADLWHPEAWEPGWTLVTPAAQAFTQQDLTVPPTSNGFTLSAANLADVTLDADRMRLAPGAAYDVTTDGPLVVRFTDGRVLRFAGAGEYKGSI